MEILNDEKERRELRKLVEQLKSDSGCVLVLGPRIAVQADDPERRPLDEILACELLSSLGEATSDTPPTLRNAADLHYRRRQDRLELQLSVRDFYARGGESTTEFHRRLARLPFRLCISASPDSLMLNAFASVGKLPQKDHYNFQPQGRSRKADLAVPTAERPLVYYLFGHHEDDASVVLTEGDLIDYLVKIIKGDPPVPDKVRSILADPFASFLFLGFGFQNWYLRVLLNVLGVYGHRFKSVAFEDPQFVDAPESKHAIAFFEDKLIEFRRLRWEPFAEQLLQTYLQNSQQDETEPASAPARPDATAPCAFLSYASEDRDAVDALAEQLQANGVRVWQDKLSLRGGDRWDELLFSVIKDEEKVHYVIVVQTVAMTMATRGIFRREIDAALQVQQEVGEFEGQRLRFLIPVTIGGCPSLFSLRGIQVVELSESSGVDRLVAAIKDDWEKRSKLRALHPA